MPDCIKCDEYTKYDGGLCFVCDKKEGVNSLSDSKKSVKVIENDKPSNGLSKKDKNYRYNMIKGRIAETLIYKMYNLR